VYDIKKMFKIICVKFITFYENIETLPGSIKKYISSLRDFLQYLA